MEEEKQQQRPQQSHLMHKPQTLGCEQGPLLVAWTEHQPQDCLFRVQAANRQYILQYTTSAAVAVANISPQGCTQQGEAACGPTTTRRACPQGKTGNGGYQQTPPEAPFRRAVGRLRFVQFPGENPKGSQFALLGRLCCRTAPTWVLLASTAKEICALAMGWANSAAAAKLALAAANWISQRNDSRTCRDTAQTVCQRPEQLSGGRDELPVKVQHPQQLLHVFNRDGK